VEWALGVDQRRPLLDARRPARRIRIDAHDADLVMPSTAARVPVVSRSTKATDGANRLTGLARRG